MRRLSIRLRQGWGGWWPSVDRSGVWPRRRWLWWVWDRLPDAAAERLITLIDTMRAKPPPAGEGGYRGRGQGSSKGGDRRP